MRFRKSSSWCIFSKVHQTFSCRIRLSQHGRILDHSIRKVIMSANIPQKKCLSSSIWERHTSSERILPQLWQTVSRSFLILLIKPVTCQSVIPFLDRTLSQHTDMKNRRGKLDMTKMTRTFIHVLIASSTFVQLIDCA